MLDALAPNTQLALKSMVPKDVKKSQHLSTKQAVQCNLQVYKKLYETMGYTSTWWESLKWGLPMEV